MRTPYASHVMARVTIGRTSWIRLVAACSLRYTRQIILHKFMFDVSVKLLAGEAHDTVDPWLSEPAKGCTEMTTWIQLTKRGLAIDCQGHFSRSGMSVRCDL